MPKPRSVAKRYSYELLDGVYKIRGPNREVLAIANELLAAERIVTALNAPQTNALKEMIAAELEEVEQDDLIRDLFECPPRRSLPVAG
jgi:hypothetical protein